MSAGIDERKRPGYANDKEELLRRLGRIQGQVGGIGRMIEGDRYCIDVVTQVSAARAALDRVAVRLLEGHTRNCVLKSDDERRAERTDELIEVLDRLLASR